MEKKLKRGLADLSKFFLSENRIQEVPEVIALHQAEASPKKYILAELSGFKHEAPPSLICASFISLSPKFQTGDFIALLERTRSAFSETFLLTVSAEEPRLREYKSLFSLSEGALERVTPIGRGMSFGCTTESDIHEISVPKVHDRKEFFDSSKKALVVFDSPVPNDALIDLLDHCVYVVEADLNQITKAYQLMRFAFSRNPMVRNSIFLIGEKIGEMCESIYDRFSITISQLLGSDLGFLGWADDREMLFNPDFLLEEGGNSIQLSSKARLSQVLFSHALA